MRRTERTHGCLSSESWLACPTLLDVTCAEYSDGTTESTACYSAAERASQHYLPAAANNRRRSIRDIKAFIMEERSYVC